MAAECVKLHHYAATANSDQGQTSRTKTLVHIAGASLPFSKTSDVEKIQYYAQPDLLPIAATIWHISAEGIHEFWLI